MIHVALVVKQGHNDSGVGRYTHELARGLALHGCAVTLVHPVVPLPRWLIRMLRRWPGWDIDQFFANYPVWACYPQADLYHFGSQNLATLMLFRRPPGPAVITVHDILPYLTRNDPTVTSHHHVFDRLLDRVALWGIGQASMLCAVSGYTRDCLIEHLGVQPDRVIVTLEGVYTYSAKQAIA